MKLRTEPSNREFGVADVTMLATILIALTLAFPLRAATQAPTLKLELRSTITLHKESGRVDGALPDGKGWVVRDYSWKTPENQRIEFYDTEGVTRGAISAYGEDPDKYVRLRDMDIDDEGKVWIADFGSGRVLAFDHTGKLVSSILLQNPSYRPKALALDQRHDRLYVAGCYPTHTFLDKGCLLVHEYKLSDGRFLSSAVETDPELVAKRWAVVGDEHLAVGPSGQVFFVQEPERKLWRLDPATDQVTSTEIESAIAEPTPALTVDQLMSNDAAKVLAASYRVDQVRAAGHLVMVSISRPNGAGYLLEVFDQDGKQLAEDIEAPGRLVGSTRDGGWVFARRAGKRFALEVGVLKQAASR